MFLLDMAPHKKQILIHIWVCTCHRHIDKPIYAYTYILIEMKEDVSNKSLLEETFLYLICVPIYVIESNSY